MCILVAFYGDDSAENRTEFRTQNVVLVNTNTIKFDGKGKKEPNDYLEMEVLQEQEPSTAAHLALSDP